MFASHGKVGEASYVGLKIPELTNEDLSRFVKKAKVETVRGRYYVYIELVNSFLDILNSITTKYLEIGRTNPVSGTIRLQSSVVGKYPETSTRDIKFYIKSIRSTGDVSEETIKIYGVDSYTWFMNINKPVGSVYDGCISDVIKQVVSETAPQLNLSIVESTDDKLGQWQSNRLSPISFVDELLNIATIASKSLTPWVINIKNDEVIMQDEGSMEASNVGYYCIGGAKSQKDILWWDVIANGGHSNSSMATATSGIDARLGVIYNDLIIGDTNTENKKFPLVNDHAFINPKSEYKEGLYGYTYVQPLPDPLISNHSIPYSEYVKINALNEYYKRLKKLNGCVVKINGHGIYSDTITSGIAVVFIEALTNNGSKHQLHGNWFVDEFEHNISVSDDDEEESGWTTQLTLYRIDKNSVGEAVPYAGR